MMLPKWSLTLTLSLASIQYSGHGSHQELELVKAAVDGQVDLLKLYLPLGHPGPVDAGQTITVQQTGAEQHLYLEFYKNWYDVALAGALLNGQEECASILIDSGYTLLENLSIGELQNAFKSGCYSICRKVFQSSRSWNRYDLYSLLSESCIRGDLEAAKIILSTPIDKDTLNIAITYAVKHGHDEVVELLFEYHVIPDSITSAADADSVISPAVLEKILEKGFAITVNAEEALYSFLAKGALAQATILMEAGVDPSTLSKDELINLISSGRLDAVELIIESEHFDESFRELLKADSLDEITALVENNQIPPFQLEVAHVASAASGNIHVFLFLAKHFKSLGSTKISPYAVAAAAEYGQTEIINAIIDNKLSDAQVLKSLLALLNEDDAYASECFKTGTDDLIIGIVSFAADLGKTAFSKRIIRQYHHAIEPIHLHYIYKKAVRKGQEEIAECLRSLGYDQIDGIKGTSVPITAIKLLPQVIEAIRSLIFMDYSDASLVHEQLLESSLLISKAIATLKSHGYTAMAELVLGLQDGLTTIRALRELGLPPDLVEHQFMPLIKP